MPDEVKSNETKWPDSIPGDNESNIVSVVCGNTHLKWSFHNGIKNDLKPALFWRTPHLKDNDVKSDASFGLARHLPQVVSDYIFGVGCAQPSTEFAKKAGEGRSNLKVYVVSVVKQQSELLTAMWRSVPSDIYTMKGDDFFTKEEGRYEDMGIDRLAVLFGAQDSQGAPSLVFDAGTAMTYAATNRDGHLLGGGIGPGMQAKFRSLSQGTAALPHVTHGNLLERIHDTLKKSTPLATFQKNTKDAMISDILSEYSCNTRRTICNWLNIVGKPDSKNNNSNSERKVLLTGGDGEVLYQLLSKGAGGILECKSSSSYEDPLLKEYSVTHQKHLVHYGIAAAIMKQHRMKLLNSQEYRDRIMEENEQLIGQRVAKEDKSKNMKCGTISAIQVSASGVIIAKTDLLSITIQYDEGEKEDVDMKELQNLLTLYKQHGEKDINAKSTPSSANKRKSDSKSSISSQSTPKKKGKNSKKSTTPKKAVSYSDPDDLKGKRVAKMFDDDTFFGTINGHEIEDGVIYWQISYDDGDAEDMEEKDLVKGFAMYEKNGHMDAIGQTGGGDVPATAPLDDKATSETAQKDNAVAMDTQTEKEPEKTTDNKTLGTGNETADESNKEQQSSEKKDAAAQDVPESEGTEITRLLV